LVISGRLLDKDGKSRFGPDVWISETSANNSNTGRRKYHLNPSTVRSDNESSTYQEVVFDGAGLSGLSNESFENQRNVAGIYSSSSSLELYIYHIHGSDMPGWTVESIYSSLGNSGSSTLPYDEDISVCSRGIEHTNITSSSIINHLESNIMDLG
jgi:hypothetical protein